MGISGGTCPPCSPRGGSRKLFWEGHIGLESRKATKRDAEDVEGRSGQEVYLPPQPTRRFGCPSGVWGRDPDTNDFGAQFCAIPCMF